MQGHHVESAQGNQTQAQSIFSQGRHPGQAGLPQQQAATMRVCGMLSTGESHERLSTPDVYWGLDMELPLSLALRPEFQTPRRRAGAHPKPPCMYTLVTGSHCQRVAETWET